MKLSTIDLFRNDMKFSAAHFTIFSATERERLHGHNYYVRSTITAEMRNGITYDYSITRKQILTLCHTLNEYMLLPKHSPFLSISEDEHSIYAQYGSDRMSFLKSDTQVLPVENITSECLAEWFVTELTTDTTQLKALKIHALSISVSTTQGQSSTATWRQTP